jgi:uncharacterized protein (TIGR00369 family)
MSERVSEAARDAARGVVAARAVAAAPETRGVAAAPETAQQAVLRYEGFQIRPHNCFACGELNNIGLQLQLHLEAGRCWTELEMPRRFEGWEGIAHGGIVCTVLDEVMAWALVASDSWGVTARLSVDFRKPVTVGQAIRAEGWITESRRRIQMTAGRIVDAATGVELATAQGTYIAATGARKRELKERYGMADGQHPAPGADLTEEPGATGGAHS